MTATIRETAQIGAQTRTAWVDAVRGLAIVLVVVGHVIQFGSHQQIDLFRNPVFVTIYAFHMPLFMFISGYLARLSFGSKAPLRVLAARARALLVPIAAWSLLGQSLATLVVQATTGRIDGRAVLAAALSGLQYPGSVLWFLWVLFLAYVFFTLAKLGERRIGVVALPLSVGLVFAIPFTDLWAFYQLKWLYPFFVAGYLVHRFGDRVHSIGRRETAASALGFIGLLLFWKLEASVYVTQMNLVGSWQHTAALWGYRYVLASAGIAACIGLVQLASQRLDLTALTRLGVASMGIYCLEEYLLGPLTAWPSPSGSKLAYFAVYVPAVSALILAVCFFLTTRVLTPSRPLRVLLLGGR